MESAWKVAGVESARNVAGVRGFAKLMESCGGLWACKVREKFVESWRVWAWKVHSRYVGGRGCAKLMERLRRGTVVCLETSRVWLEGAWVTVCGSVSWALTWVGH